MRCNTLNADLLNNVGQIASTPEHFNQAKFSPLSFIDEEFLSSETPFILTFMISWICLF